MMEILMQTYSEADSYLSTGVAIGILLGLVVMALALFMFREAEYRNYKMWYLQLEEKDKQDYDTYLSDAHNAIDKLSKSNTRLFKRMFNNLCRLKSYMLFKWLQN